MRRFLVVCAFVTVAFGFFVAPALAVTVTNVEVTQATQTPTNSIKLIARRSTAVRATPATGDRSGRSAAGQ
jgi:hypothetical protein